MTDELRSPSLTQAILNCIVASRYLVHTQFPGKVARYNAEDDTIDVEPLLKQRCGPKEVDYPVLPNVRLARVDNGDCIATFPVAPGDFVWLEVAERPLDIAEASGEAGPMPDARVHSITDILARPWAMQPMARRVEPRNQTSAVWGHRSALVTSGPDGVTLGDPATASLVALAGPTQADFDALKAVLQALQADMLALSAGVGAGVGAATASVIAGVLPTFPQPVAATRTKAV